MHCQNTKDHFMPFIMYLSFYALKVIFLRLTSSELIKAKRMELKIKYKKEKTANIDSKKVE